MKTSLFNYQLPQKYIANTIAGPRDHSQLLVLNRKLARNSHHQFFNLPDLLSPFAKNLERELVDESEEVSLRRDSAPDEATGRRYPGRKPAGASSKNKAGKRIIAVGTTTRRVLKSCAKNSNVSFRPGFPPQFQKQVYGLSELISRKAYFDATRNNYRFYSFGDAMLIT